LEQLTDWKTNDRQLALKKALEADKLPIGVFYQETKKAYHQEVSSLQTKPLVEQSIEKIDITKLIEEFE